MEPYVLGGGLIEFDAGTATLRIGRCLLVFACHVHPCSWTARQRRSAVGRRRRAMRGSGTATTASRRARARRQLRTRRPAPAPPPPAPPTLGMLVE